MNFIPLSKEEQRKMATRRTPREDGVTVRATHSSAAGEGSLIVHDGQPQSLQHIMEREDITSNVHIKDEAKRLNSLERDTPLQQEQDLYAKTSLHAEQSYPQHKIGETPGSVHSQAPLEQEISHLTINSHQEPTPTLAQQPILVKKVVTSVEVEQDQTVRAYEQLQVKKDDVMKKSQQNMKIEMIESQYEHEFGKDHRDVIKTISSHEERPTHFTDSNGNTYRIFLSNEVGEEQQDKVILHPQVQPNPTQLTTKQQHHQPTLVHQHNGQIDTNHRPALVKQSSLEVKSIGLHGQVNQQKCKLTLSVQNTLHKAVAQQRNRQEIIQNTNPQQMQKSKSSLPPHLEQSQVSKLISIGHFEESMLMQQSTKLKRDLKTNRMIAHEIVVRPKVEMSHSQGIHMEGSLKLKRELMMNNLPLVEHQKAEMQPVIVAVNQQTIDVGHSEDMSKKLKRELKLNNEPSFDSASPIHVRHSPLIVSIPSSNQEYFSQSITKSKRLLSPSNKLAFHELQRQSVVSPPLEGRVKSSQQIGLQLDESQENKVPEMRESMKIQRKFQSYARKMSDIVPADNLKAVGIQYPTEQTYQHQEVQSLKRLPNNTLPQQRQQQCHINLALPISCLHIEPAQRAQTERPYHSNKHQDCKSEKSIRSDITQGWDEKKQIFKVYKLPAQPNPQQHIRPVIPRRPINSLHFK